MGSRCLNLFYTRVAIALDGDNPLVLEYLPCRHRIGAIPTDEHSQLNIGNDDAMFPVHIEPNPRHISAFVVAWLKQSIDVLSDTHPKGPVLAVNYTISVIEPQGIHLAR
jgi:hypothetical protein